MYNTKIKIEDYSNIILDIPNNIKNNIKEFIDDNINKDDLANKNDIPDYANDGLIYNSHISILLGIKTNNPNDIKEYINNNGNINVILGKTNYFNNRFVDYDVVYLEVLSRDIRALRNKLTKSIDYADISFSFMPHMSLAYVKKGKGKDYKGLDNFEGTKIEFDSVLFTTPEGNKTIINL